MRYLISMFRKTVFTVNAELAEGDFVFSVKMIGKWNTYTVPTSSWKVIVIAFFSATVSNIFQKMIEGFSKGSWRGFCGPHLLSEPRTAVCPSFASF